MNFSDRYGPWALVAGASEGIGASAARSLGERGIRVVLVSRRKGLLDEVARSIVTDTKTVPLDLSEPDAVTTLASATADLEVGLLLYNAGAVAPMRFFDQPLDAWQKVVSRNCLTLLGSVHHFGSRMAERGRGGIVLVSSNAAWAGTAGLAVYGATKAFQLVLGESLWAELRQKGVDVLSSVLGATDTPAFRRMLGGRELGGAASSEDVARELLDGLGAGPTQPGGPSPFASMPRQEAVELRSQRVAGHFG